MNSGELEVPLATVWFYLIVVGMVAIPIALFEIWGIGHFKVGWGDPLPSNTVWGKPILKKAPFNLAGAVLLTRYHFVMYLVVVPTGIATIISALKSWVLDPPATWIAWALFMVACILGVMELEDFLFFVFSSTFGSPYPHALARLLRGEANWHPHQINFGHFKLPDFYVWFPLIIALLLRLSSQLGS